MNQPQRSVHQDLLCTNFVVCAKVDFNSHVNLAEFYPNSKPETRNPKSETRPQILNPKPEPETRIRLGVPNILKWLGALGPRIQSEKEKWSLVQ